MVVAAAATAAVVVVVVGGCGDGDGDGGKGSSFVKNAQNIPRTHQIQERHLQYTRNASNTQKHI